VGDKKRRPLVGAMQKAKQPKPSPKKVKVKEVEEVTKVEKEETEAKQTLALPLDLTATELAKPVRVMEEEKMSEFFAAGEYLCQNE
jgi:hypothetical protein